MALDQKHPGHEQYAEDWQLLGDCYRGERAIKAAGTTYLPATKGMVADGFPNAKQPGTLAYAAYKLRAVFHDFFYDAVTNLTGVLHRHPATIELPAVLEPMRDRATNEGESLNALHRKITASQLRRGRMGMLLDVPDGASADKAIPYVAVYKALSIVNWDTVPGLDAREELSFLVLDETGPLRDADQSWEEQEKYRVVAGTLEATSLGATDLGAGDYHVGVAKESKETGDLVWTTPAVPGQTMDALPFVFVNAADLCTATSRPPLLGLAELSLTIYRGEADHRQQLFMQAQETLKIAADKPDDPAEAGQDKIGAGAVLYVGIGGDADYIGISGEGLTERREQLTDDKTRASSKGSQMLDQRSKQIESGESMQTREAAKAVTLVDIARAGAEGLQTILRHAAVWMGADPETVIVTPYMDFADVVDTFEDLNKLMDAVLKGFPLRDEDLHAIAVERGLTDATFEDWQKAQEEKLEAFGLDGASRRDPDPSGGDDPPDDE